MLDIDVVSFNSYVHHLDNVRKLEQVQQAIAVRVAFGADKKDFKKWMNEMLKDQQGLPSDAECRRDGLAFLKLVGKKGGI